MPGVRYHRDDVSRGAIENAIPSAAGRTRAVAVTRAEMKPLKVPNQLVLTGAISICRCVDDFQYNF